MDKSVFALLHYSALFLLAVVCYVFGSRLTRRIAYDSHLEKASFSIALGLGLIAYLVLFLGLAGLLYAYVLLALLVAGLLLCHRTWISWPRNALALWGQLKSFNKNRLIVLALITGAFFLCLPFLILPLYPPTAWDATEYHLASAKIYARSHQLEFTPYLRFPVFPQTNQMLFTLALLLCDDVAANLIQLLMMAILAMALIAFGKRFFSERAGWWAAAFLLGSPFVIRLGTIAYIELGLMLFVTMAVYAVWAWLQSRQTRWLMLAAIFCGLAIGTKYTAMFILLVLFAVASYTSLKERKCLQPVFFAALAMLVASPWLVRNYYYMRNPVFPFFHDAFGQLFGYGEWQPEYFQGIFNNYSGYGMGKSIQALIMLPWNLVANWKEFGGGVISPLYFFVPHLLFIAGIARQKIKGLLAVGIAFTLFWFFSVQETRFLVPALPILSLATAAALDSLLLRIPFLQRWSSRRLITAIAMVLLLSPSCIWAILRLRERGPLPANQDQRHAYLAHRLPSYSAYRLLNDLKGRNYAIYAIYDENMAYFAEGLFMGDHFGPARYSRVVDKLADGEALYHELISLGADYLLVRDDLAKADLLESKSFQNNFKLIYSTRPRGCPERVPRILLFELNRARAAIRPQLLSAP